MVDESLMNPDRPFRVRSSGEAGTIPAAPATSLSVVLPELLKTAVDHAFPDQVALADVPGSVDVLLVPTDPLLTVDRESVGEGQWRVVYVGLGGPPTKTK